MAVRPIDASRFGEILEQWKKDCLEDNDTQGADIISDVILQLDDMPTLTPPNEWVSVEEKLPENDGWYLVYAPGYWGNSKIYGLDGLAYSNFKHNYKVHWGIERGTGRGWPGIVTHWMYLPEPPKKET